MSQPFEHLEPPDRFHLEAAEGWFELGNGAEAQAELAQLTPELQTHPLALELRWQLHAQARQWETAISLARELATRQPDHAPAWIHWAYSLHELKRTREAREILHPQAARFPNEHVIPYNLACYACQLGNLDETRQWLKKAMQIVGKKTILAMAAADPDLKPLGKDFGEIEKLPAAD